MPFSILYRWFFSSPLSSKDWDYLQSALQFQTSLVVIFTHRPSIKDHPCGAWLFLHIFGITNDRIMEYLGLKWTLRIIFVSGSPVCSWSNIIPALCSCISHPMDTDCRFPTSARTCSSAPLPFSSPSNCSQAEISCLSFWPHQILSLHFLRPNHLLQLPPTPASPIYFINMLFTSTSRWLVKIDNKWLATCPERPLPLGLMTCFMLLLSALWEQQRWAGLEAQRQGRDPEGVPHFHVFLF